MSKSHWLLDTLKGLDDSEKDAMFVIADLKGVSVPDVITEALREYTQGSTAWIVEQLQKREALKQAVG